MPQSAIQTATIAKLLMMIDREADQYRNKGLNEIDLSVEIFQIDYEKRGTHREEYKKAYEYFVI